MNNINANLLRELLSECTEGQNEMFCKMYISVEKIPIDKINRAYEQIELTIEKNKNNHYK